MRRPRTTIHEFPAEFLSAKQAAAYLGYENVHTFRQAYVKLGIPAHRLGWSLRFRREDLEAALTKAEVVPVTARRKRA